MKRKIGYDFPGINHFIRILTFKSFGNSRQIVYRVYRPFYPPLSLTFYEKGTLLSALDNFNYMLLENNSNILKETLLFGKLTLSFKE